MQSLLYAVSEFSLFKLLLPLTFALSSVLMVETEFIHTTGG